MTDEKTEIPRPLAQSIVVTNNAMGHDRRPITAKHEEAMKQVRDAGLEFYCLLHQLGLTDPNQERFKNREFAVAATNIEEAVMWACKGICKI